MSRYWNPAIKQLQPYIPGEQPKDGQYIKLNTNENPYPPSPKVLKAIKEGADSRLRLYPDPSCTELKECIARYYHLRPENVFIGNGSDEVLAFCFPAFFNPNKPLLFADITYSFYKVYAELFHTVYQEIPLDGEFNIRIEDYFKDNGGVIIANPNAPTAKLLPTEDIKSLLENNPDSVVIIDEAYIDFGGESSVKLIKDYPNLLVVQTLSKSRSLAGLRVGFALGHEDLIEGLDRVKNSFNSYTLDRLAISGAIEAINDEPYFQKTRLKIIETRERVAEELRKSGFKVTDSQANFIFINHQSLPAGVLFQQLKENQILVRYFDKPGIDNYLRITIGTDDEMDRFLEVIRGIVEENS